MVKQFKIFAITVAVICINQFAYAEQPSSGKNVYNNVSQSVLTVFSINESDRSKTALGSAVAITEHLMATNCHVALAGNFLVVDVDKKTYLGTLFYYNQKKDICIVEISGAKLKPVQIRPSATVQIGEEVYAIGNPENYTRTISRGIISNKIKSDETVMLQTDASISHGSSGLFDTDGNLVGITTEYDPRGENIGFAIPTELILEIINPERLKIASASHTQTKENDSENYVPLANEYNKLIRIGYYGNSEIGLMRLNNKCFITIVGRYKPTHPTSLAIWHPDEPNKLMIFSRTVTAENAIKFINWANDKDFQYAASKSFLYFDKRLYPLTIVTVNKEKQPVYIFSIKNDLTEDLVTLDYFLAQFYGYNQNEGMTTIKFTLNGFTEALADYNKYCN